MRVVWLGVTGLLLSCGAARGPQGGPASSWPPEAARDLGPVVARVGEVPIYAAQVEAQARRDGQSPREALQALVSFQLLAERAGAEGLKPPSAEDGAPVKAALVQRLLERELEPTLGEGQVPEAELRTIYERAKDHFVHGRLVDLVVLSVYTGARMRPEARERARATALALKAHVDARPIRDPQDFFTIARTPSWAQQRVQVLRRLQSADYPFSAQVGTAAAKLQAVGDTTPLIEDEMGYHIGRYAGERPPKNITFEEARAELLRGYLVRWRENRFAQFAVQLGQSHDVQVFPGRLETVPFSR